MRGQCQTESKKEEVQTDSSFDRNGQCEVSGEQDGRQLRVLSSAEILR